MVPAEGLAANVLDRTSQRCPFSLPRRTLQKADPEAVVRAARLASCRGGAPCPSLLSRQFGITAVRILS